MGTVAQDFAGHPHRIAQMFDAAHASRAQAGTVHDQSIELHLAFAIQKAAAAGVEAFVIFQDHNRLLDRVERAALAVEHIPAGSPSFFDPQEMRPNDVVRNRPGAAVHYQYGIDRQVVLRQEMIDQSNR